MVKPFTVKSFSAIASLLVATAGVGLALGAAPGLADGLLNIEPVSSDELLAEKGEGLDGGLLVSGGDPLRRRIPGGGITVEGNQNTVAIGSGSSSQFNSSSLNALNDLVNISNVAGSAGGGG